MFHDACGSDLQHVVLENGRCAGAWQGFNPRLCVTLPLFACSTVLSVTFVLHCMQTDSEPDPDPVPTKTPLEKAQSIGFTGGGTPDQRAKRAALGIKKSGNITRKVRDARNAADKLGPAEANAKVQESTARVAELEAEVSSLHRTNPDRPP